MNLSLMLALTTRPPVETSIEELQPRSALESVGRFRPRTVRRRVLRAKVTGSAGDKLGEIADNRRVSSDVLSLSLSITLYFFFFFVFQPR